MRRTQFGPIDREHFVDLTGLGMEIGATTRVTIQIEYFRLRCGTRHRDTGFVNSRVAIVEQIGDVLVNMKVDLSFPLRKYEVRNLLRFPMEPIAKLLTSVTD